MKKLFLSVAIATLSLVQVNAQDAPLFGFAEGDVFVEGNIGFNSVNDKDSDTKENGFEFTPKVGYLLSDFLAVGAELNIGSNKNDTSGTETYKVSTFGVGVFGRYYFLDLGKRFKTFTELGLGYTTLNNKLADFKVNTFEAGLDLGINYFVTENIALTFGLDNLISFTSSKLDASGAEAVTEFNLGAGSVNNPFGRTTNFGLLFKL